MNRKTTIAAMLFIIMGCASFAYSAEGWNPPSIEKGQTALPLGAPYWMMVEPISVIR